MRPEKFDLVTLTSTRLNIKINDQNLRIFLSLLIWEQYKCNQYTKTSTFFWYTKQKEPKYMYTYLNPMLSAISV